MGEQASANLKGFDELQKFLDQLPAKLQKNVMRGAMRAGANVVKAAAVARAPQGPTSGRNADRYGGYAGALRDSIRVSVNAKDGVVTAKVIAGGKTKGGADVYYGRWVEYGTKPHTITARGHSALSVGGLLFQSVLHPGANAHAFMRPALNSALSATILAVGNYIKVRLSTKEGLDTADIELGVGDAQ